MKFRVVIALALLAGLQLGCTTVFAKPGKCQPPPPPQYATVNLDATVVNNVVVVTAITEREGSRMEDAWTGEGLTVLRSRRHHGRSYVSEATFSPTATGVYYVSYDITMSAGCSARNTWVGGGRLGLCITVDENGVVTLD